MQAVRRTLQSFKIYKEKLTFNKEKISNLNLNQKQHKSNGKANNKNLTSISKISTKILPKQKNSPCY